MERRWYPKVVFPAMFLVLYDRQPAHYGFAQGGFRWSVLGTLCPPPGAELTEADIDWSDFTRPTCASPARPKLKLLLEKLICHGGPAR
jgi:hypothetical protein